MLTAENPDFNNFLSRLSTPPVHSHVTPPFVERISTSCSRGPAFPEFPGAQSRADHSPRHRNPLLADLPASLPVVLVRLVPGCLFEKHRCISFSALVTIPVRALPAPSPPCLARPSHDLMVRADRRDRSACRSRRSGELWPKCREHTASDPGISREALTSSAVPMIGPAKLSIPPMSTYMKSHSVALRLKLVYDIVRL